MNPRIASCVLHAAASLRPLLARSGFLARGVGAILFLPQDKRGVMAGSVLLLMLCFTPSAALGGLLALAGSWGFARLAGMRPEPLRLPAHVYNALLAGLAVGHGLAPGSGMVALCLLAGVVALLLTVMLAETLHAHCSLPALSLPFAVAAAGLGLLLAKHGSQLTAAGPPLWSFLPEPELPLWLTGFFKALGSLFFSPSIWIGLGIGLLLALCSRQLLLLALLGHLCGSLATGLLSGSLDQAWIEPHGFNAMLTAMAMGGVFAVPGLAGWTLAAAAAALCALCTQAMLLLFASFSVPVTTLPFVVCTLLTLFLLRQAQSPLLPHYSGAIPEETLELQALFGTRFGPARLQVQPPCSGEWTVWQGFDGAWTHKGQWRHALDFVIAEPSGATHRGDGRRLEDYYAWGKPVLAPVAGLVTAVVNHLPDNPPGMPDVQNNWGNAVLLQTADGSCVQLSHLQQGSAAVAAGQHVLQGQLLGRCGNSGYSPEPHIHLQAQSQNVVGAATVPFALAAFWKGKTLLRNAVPQTGQRVTGLSQDQRAWQAWALSIGEELRVRLQSDADAAGEWQDNELVLRAAVGEDGRPCLTSDRGRLLYARSESMLTLLRAEGDDACQRLLLAALPSLPLTADMAAGSCWQDSLPLCSLHDGWRKAVGRAALLLAPGLGMATVELRAVLQGVEALARPQWKFLQRLPGMSLHTLVSLDARGLPQELTVIHAGAKVGQRQQHCKHGRGNHAKCNSFSASRTDSREHLLRTDGSQGQVHSWDRGPETGGACAGRGTGPSCPGR